MAFDPSTAHEGEPCELVVGDRIQWKRTDLAAQYDPDLYDLSYTARSDTGQEIQANATVLNGAYLVTITSLASSDFAPGFYYWQAEITRKSDQERIVVDRGTFTVTADLQSSTAAPASHARIMLTKIEKLLEGRADSDTVNYSIAGRSLTKMSPAELLEWRDRYRQELQTEQRKNDLASGCARPATVKVRF
jgi:hypothetical protein